MVLIDSSPWIDMLSGRSTAEAELLTGWLRDARPVATTGAVLQEVLRGARTDRDLSLLRGRFARLPFLRAEKETYIEAARLFRRTRARGWTVPATDALIAAVALVHGVALLTTDHRHFRALARVSKLRLAG
jgi:predicted nucleic acid-binding protein